MSQTIAVEHIRISSKRSFAGVRRKLEGTVPKLNTGIAEVLRSGDQKRAKICEDNGQSCRSSRSAIIAPCCRFGAGDATRCNMKLAILTASEMTRYQLAAALYAPLRVVLFEDEQGRGIFEYDRPSSLFRQYSDERVTEVGRYLDATLEAILLDAAD